MCVSLPRQFLRRSSLSLLASFGLFASLAPQVEAQQVLEIYADSLTTYKPSGNTAVQGVRPLHLQRGVGVDGSLRSRPGLAIALQGNPFEDVWLGHDRQGDLNLATGAWSPFEVDIALPAKGFSWVIGRTYNARQETSGGSATDSNGYQGYNWFQVSQPEIALYDDADNTKDVLYLVYGAGAYVEYLRTGSSSNDYKGKNGAAGIFVYAAGAGAEPDTFTLTDQRGNTVAFFGFDGDSGTSAGQLWKMTDPDSNTAFVGQAATGSSAISSGYSSGRITTAYDTSDRRFTYTYTSVDSVSRLTRVKAETKTGGTWASPTGVSTVAQVDYTYYAVADSDIANGSSGDLKMVTITEYLDDSITLTKKRYFRYWKGTYNSSTNPGYPHALWYTYDFEGVRSFDWAGDSSFDEDFLSATESSLRPYAAAYFEYDSAHKVREAWFNGQCGCSGGSNGTFEYTFATVSYTNSSGYDSAPALRTVIKRPDASYRTVYLDETGQALSDIITDIDPAGGGTIKKWVTRVTRDGGGGVDLIGTPASLDTYDHSTGGITTSSSVGLVRRFYRELSGNMTGFLLEEKHKEGNGVGVSAYLDHTYTWTSFSKSVSAGTVYRPLLASERVYSTEITTGTSGSYLTSYSYTNHSGTLATETVAKTNPTVSTGNNGSGSATYYNTHYRLDGLVDYEKDEDGIITYHGYTDGLQTTLIQDADTASLPEPSGFTSSTDPVELTLTTTTSYSAQGFQQVNTPPHNVDKILRTRLADHRLVVLTYTDFVSGSPSTFYGPVTYTVLNQAGKAEVRAVVGLASNQTTTATSGHIDESDADPITAADLGTVKQMTTFIRSEAGTRLDEERRYFVIPASGVGSDGTNYDPTKYGYNDSGTRWRTKDASGTIRRTVFDAIGRVLEHWIGTNDNSFSGGEASGTDNMVKTHFVNYDNNADGKNGHVTESTVRVQSSSTDERVTAYTYDLRGRLLLQANPTAPHAFYKYDNMGRRIAAGLFSGTGSIAAATDDPTTETTNRLALTQTFFDERGQVWKSQRHKIDAADGSDDDNLQALNWYDASGRITKVDGETLKKTKYDRIGRVTDEYVLAVDNDSTYGDADDVTGDIVLEERQARYHATDGTVTQRCRIDRFHSDISTGETTGALDTNADANATTLTSTNIKGRIQITAYYYDRIERETDRVEYGTYAGGTWTRPSTADARSDTALRTTTAYSTDGTIEAVTDPKALVTKWEYDAQGRKTRELRNYDVAVNSGNPSGTDDNVTTSWAYTDGLLTSLTADVPNGETDQVTTYIYGTTKDTPSQMKIATGHLLRAVKYPDSSNSGTSLANIDSDSSDVVSLAYNAQGEEVYKKDQAGSVIQSDFDASGRNTQKRVTTVASGFDNAILRIATTYDGLGRRSEVVQYDNATVGSGTAKDGVKHTYDGWGLIEKFETDRNSAVAGGGDDYEVSYVWTKATLGRNTLRKTEMTVPGGRAISYSYRSAGGLHDDEASRVTLVKDGATTICQYDYNGVGQVVRTKYNEASVMWEQFSSTAGDYPDLDRFNRVVRSRWTKDLSTDVDFYRVDLEYDRNANITWAEDQVHSGFDVKYTMDDVNRLTRTEEGTRSGTSITSRARDQQWTLTHTGNWELDKVDLNGDGDFVDGDELNDDRTHNAVNELTARDTEDNGTDNYSLTYDVVGNLTDDAEDAKYEYDVLGRLRNIKRTTTSALVAEHRYNGLGFRIGIHEDTDTDGDVDASDKWFYDAFDERWRHVARYRESDTSPKEDFVPHQAGESGNGVSSYVDLVICRNKDANTSWTVSSDGTLEERHYYCQNWRADVSVLVNAAGTLLKEGVKYSAYGVPFGLPGGDTNSDGDCDSADVTQVNTWRTANPVHYDVRGDIDLSGVVDAIDESTIQSSFSGITLAREKLSAGSIANRRGLAGGEHVMSAIYHVRNRFLATGLGRWLRRDPLGYVDGVNRYEYVSGRPLVLRDPLGLQGFPPPNYGDGNTAANGAPAFWDMVYTLFWGTGGPVTNHGDDGTLTCADAGGGECVCLGGGGESTPPDMDVDTIYVCDGVTCCTYRVYDWMDYCDVEVTWCGGGMGVECEGHDLSPEGPCQADTPEVRAWIFSQCGG